MRPLLFTHAGLRIVTKRIRSVSRLLPTVIYQQIARPDSGLTDWYSVLGDGKNQLAPAAAAATNDKWMECAVSRCKIGSTRTRCATVPRRTLATILAKKIDVVITRCDQRRLRRRRAHVTPDRSTGV